VSYKYPNRKHVAFFEQYKQHYSPLEGFPILMSAWNRSCDSLFFFIVMHWVKWLLRQEIM